MSNLEGISAAGAPARMDTYGTVVTTNLVRQPWTGKGAPDIGIRFVQDAVGNITIYDRNSRAVYFVPTTEVAGVAMTSTQSFIRRTPPWAIVLGVIGLFFFLIGIVFFFIKENVPRTVPSFTVTTTAGRTLVFQGV